MSKINCGDKVKILSKTNKVEGFVINEGTLKNKKVYRVFYENTVYDIQHTTSEVFYENELELIKEKALFENNYLLTLIGQNIKNPIDKEEVIFNVGDKILCIDDFMYYEECIYPDLVFEINSEINDHYNIITDNKYNIFIPKDIISNYFIKLPY